MKEFWRNVADVWLMFSIIMLVVLFAKYELSCDNGFYFMDGQNLYYAGYVGKVVDGEVIHETD